jgi:hypothetical protein
MVSTYTLESAYISTRRPSLRVGGGIVERSEVAAWGGSVASRNGGRSKCNERFKEQQENNRKEQQRETRGPPCGPRNLGLFNCLSRRRVVWGASRVKRIERVLARWGLWGGKERSDWVGRGRRSKSERILLIKMTRSGSAEVGSTKRGLC